MDNRLERLIDEIHQLLPGQYFLIISNLSPAILNKVLEARLDNDPHLRVIHRNGSTGRGTAQLAMMEYAMEKNFEALLTLDEYFLSTRAVEISEAAKMLSQHELILGTRIPPSPAGLKNLPRILSAKFSGLAPLDAACSFRGYSTPLLKRWHSSTYTPKGMEWDSLFVVQSLYRLLFMAPAYKEFFLSSDHFILKKDIISQMGLLLNLLAQRKKFTHSPLKVIS